MGDNAAGTWKWCMSASSSLRVRRVSSILGALKRSGCDCRYRLSAVRKTDLGHAGRALGIAGRFWLPLR